MVIDQVRGETTLEMEGIATLYRQRHMEVMVKWCRAYQTKRLMSALKIQDSMTTLYKQHPAVDYS